MFKSILAHRPLVVAAKVVTLPGEGSLAGGSGWALCSARELCFCAASGLLPFPSVFTPLVLLRSLRSSILQQGAGRHQNCHAAGQVLAANQGLADPSHCVLCGMPCCTCNHAADFLVLQCHHSHTLPGRASGLFARAACLTGVGCVDLRKPCVCVSLCVWFMAMHCAWGRVRLVCPAVAASSSTYMPYHTCMLRRANATHAWELLLYRWCAVAPSCHLNAVCVAGNRNHHWLLPFLAGMRTYMLATHELTHISTNHQGWGESHKHKGWHGCSNSCCEHTHGLAA